MIAKVVGWAGSGGFKRMLLPLLPYAVPAIVAVILGTNFYFYQKGKRDAVDAVNKAQIEALIEDQEETAAQAVVDRERAERAITAKLKIDQDTRDVKEGWEDLPRIDCALPPEWDAWLRAQSVQEY